MTPKISYTDILFISALTVGGILGGFVNGLLGTGGGIVITYVYFLFACGKKINAEDRFVSAMVTVIPISLISLSTYSSNYLRDPVYLIGIIIPSAIGGLIGALLSTKVKPVLLEKAFAILVIYAGIKMIL